MTHEPSMQAGQHCRGAEKEQGEEEGGGWGGAPRLPPVAQLHAHPRLPGLSPAERHQADLRAPQGSQSQRGAHIRRHDRRQL